jgi:predicted dehydrogenase/nucleoside-diphosphate-sugar epimerase
MRLGIVGCGAAATKLHLPGLVEDGSFELTALVDTVRAHAQTAADRYRMLAGDAPVLVTEDLAEALDRIDAAVVASASGSHADIAATLLLAGKHVLVEKPMALSLAQCNAIRVAAAAGGAMVLPGQVRRLFPLARLVKSILDSERLGAVHRVRWSEGSPFDWGVASASMFGPQALGGGVLADVGPHVFDMLCYWFGQSAEVTRLATNSEVGCDSEVEVTVNLGGITAEVELSRLRQLSDQIVVEAAHGSLTIDIDIDDAGYVERDSSGVIQASGPIPVLPGTVSTWDRLFAQQFAEFGRAIVGAANPLATFEDGVVVARLLEACRTVPATRVPRPWMDARPLPDRPVANRVAVTGATGFVGAHVVERMVSSAGTQVVAVVRNLRRLARLSHLDHDRVHYAQADIRDRAALKEIFRDCDVVVHTAYGTSGGAAEQWAVTVDGTAAVLGAAIDAGVSRVVHISTVDVYDTVDSATLDESCPRLRRTDRQDSYRQQKLAAEDLAMAADGVQVVCLQPTIVYGPWGPTWTVSVLDEDLRTANETLPTGPDTGVCNALHVHDLADAIHFAATAADIDHVQLLVSGPETIGWGAFYDGHRRLLGVIPPDFYDREQVPGSDRALYESPVVVSTERLAALGFQPSIGIAEGMAQLAGWAAWAGLLGDK